MGPEGQTRGGHGRTQRQHGPGGAQRLTRGNIQTQWIWAVHIGVHPGTPGITVAPTLGLNLQKSQH